MDYKVTDEERRRALKFCCENLTGAWKEVSLSQVEICKLCGGMTNLLYYCALLDSVRTLQGEPKQVLLRLYGPSSHGDTESQLEVFNKLAAENLGPKLYGTFGQGRLEEYFPSSPLTWTEITSDSVSAAVARKIASIHKLHVNSLEKERNWLINTFYELHDFILSSDKNPPFDSETEGTTKAIALELIDVDFKPEIDYMTSLLADSQAPLVFSHNDLHQNNILLLKQIDKDHDLVDRIVLIDFEYCSYNYRTFDLANHLCEWCFDYTGEDYPHFNASLARFPSDEKQRQFLKEYAGLLSDNEFQDDPHHGEGEGEKYKVDILFNEMQPFFMASNMLWALWAIKSAYTSKVKFGYWEMAKCKWELYQYCKGQFKQRFESNRSCDGDFILQSSKM